MTSRPATIQWIGGVKGHLEILDQRLLPEQVVTLKLYTVEQVWKAIRTLAVRGAPAIGIAAAFGVFVAARTIPQDTVSAVLIKLLNDQGNYLKTSRPTAVNLAWAVDHLLHIAASERGIGVRALQARLLQEAQKILEDDRAMCLAIGEHGSGLIQENAGVLTHCNAGALATADFGTALSIIYRAHQKGTRFRVFVDETRPLLQGARLTAWELMASQIDATLICDNMAGLVMQQGKVNLVVVGADRITRRGDTANKIGTYSLAVLAKAHDIPFVVAAPSTTFDLKIASGSEIPIEERGGEEITMSFGKQIAPEGVKTFNPAFDVTPAHLITTIVTERGIISPVNEETIAANLNTKSVHVLRSPDADSSAT